MKAIFSSQDIGRCFKLIIKAHEMNPDMIRTGDFMHRWCATLELPKDVQKAATNIAKMAVDLDIVPGRSPISVAAAAIYMASQVRSSGHFWAQVSKQCHLPYVFHKKRHPKYEQ